MRAGIPPWEVRLIDLPVLEARPRRADSSEIEIIIGTRVNIAHQDPNLPVDLEIRRTVVKRMARLLEEKFLKEVSIRFI